MAPACGHWKLDTNILTLNLDNGVRVDFPWLHGTDVGTADATLISPDGGQWHGPANGGLLAGPGITLDATWTSEAVHGPNSVDTTVGPTNHFTGAVNPETRLASGTTTNQAGQSNKWTIADHFVCADAPSAAEGGVGAEAKAGVEGTEIGVGAPPPAEQAPPPVTDAIRLSFGPSKFTSITATVTNSSDVKAACTYDATPSDTHRDFTVPAKGSTNLTFSGLGVGVTYHAVVSCHDADGKQPQEIGRAETDVTF